MNDGLKSNPEGLWRTFDDRTGRERGSVLIYIQDGALSGRIASTTDPAEGARTCDRARDDRKGKPILGLIIIKDMRQNGTANWNGGQILDPETGTLYGCTIRLTDGGQKLIVRGFLGLPIIGRSQTWLRTREQRA